LPPPPAAPVALGVGLSPEDRRSLEERGWIVQPFEPASASELDPFRLDLADLLAFGSNSPSLVAQGAATVERCLRSGPPVGIAESASRALFGERPPPGLRSLDEPARESALPVRVRAGAAAPRTLALCGLSGAVAALLLGPVALVLLAHLL